MRESSLYNVFFLFVLKEKQEQSGDPTKLRLQRSEIETSSHSDRKHVKASPGKTLTAIIVCHALYKASVSFMATFSS